MTNSLNKRQRLWSKEVVDNNLEYDFLGNKNIDFKSLPTPASFVVTAPFINRIDLISYQVYGTVDLWWLICIVNDILDPFSEVTLGKTLKIVTLDAYYNLYNKNITVPKNKITGIFQRRFN